MRTQRLVLALVVAAFAEALGAEEGTGLPTIDARAFTQLRMAYAERPDFNPTWAVNKERDAIKDACKNGDDDAVVALSARWLQKHPIDADVHMFRAFALRAKNDLPGYLHHKYMHAGLVASIAASGDGRSQETAMKVICVKEEYLLLNAIEARMRKQGLMSAGGRFYDVMECTMGDKEITLYFDVTISMKALARTLKPKD